MLMDMDPHLLRTFVTVSRLASFSAAARELGYTQSAVSQHIAALENDLGTPLLSRRPVAPTRAGERLLEHAGSLLLRLDAARADLARLTAEPAGGAVTLAASPLAAAHPGILAALPPTSVTLHVIPRDEVPAAVATGAADLGVADGLAAPNDPLPLPDMARLTASALGTARGLTEDPLTVLFPADHPLARRARTGLRLDDLVDARWIDAPAAGFPLQRLRAAHGSYGFRPALRYDGTDVRTLAALAAAGHGLTLLPATAAAATPGGVAVPLAGSRLVHRTELVTAGEPTGAAGELVRRLSRAV
ncbi:hypothetical protein GCM10014713_09170 [Streptomyces purpureus]|uniref:HTH lysR-type domain-containing protein n=2 Tax=Streptomyces purpureus TaxID=1951 RepID=A0A918GXA2_9ACTN|nr:hypothetical protein GCM10014713_09170 [Streptomyces purpureus]